MVGHDALSGPPVAQLPGAAGAGVVFDVLPDLAGVLAAGKPDATQSAPTASGYRCQGTRSRLDRPILARYANWVSHAVRGDFGTTITGQPVGTELGRRIGVSLRLLVVGSVFGTVAGVVIGAWGAIRQYRLSDRVMTTLALLVLSTPTFVVANLLILGALRVNWAVGIQLFDYTGRRHPALPAGCGIG